MIKKLYLISVLFFLFSCNQTDNVKEYKTKLNQSTHSENTSSSVITDYPYDSCNIKYDEKNSCELDSRCYWDINGNSCLLYDNKSMLVALIFNDNQTKYLAIKLFISSNGIVSSNDHINDFKLFCKSLYLNNEGTYEYKEHPIWDKTVLSKIDNTKYSMDNFILKIFEGNAELSISEFDIRSNKPEVIGMNLERWLGQLNLPVNEQKLKSIFEKSMERFSSNVGEGILFNLR